MDRRAARLVPIRGLSGGVANNCSESDLTDATEILSDCTAQKADFAKLEVMEKDGCKYHQLNVQFG